MVFKLPLALANSWRPLKIIGLQPDISAKAGTYSLLNRQLKLTAI
jgi:hypothetical protein